MSLVMNGVEIPENVANAFSFNGVNITDIFFNGVQVWNQSLFAGVFSGDSTITFNGAWSTVDTSGNLIRHDSGYRSSFGQTGFASLGADGNFTSSGDYARVLGVYLAANYMGKGANALERFINSFADKACGSLIYDKVTNTFSRDGFGAYDRGSNTWSQGTWAYSDAGIEFSGSQFRAYVNSYSTPYVGAWISIS